MGLMALFLLVTRRVGTGGHGPRQASAALLFSLVAVVAWGQSQESPLKPPDRSSPRAALKTFLDASDAIATFVAQDYLPDPTRAKFEHLLEMSAIPVGSLDLSALPPAARVKGSRAAAMDLYEVLSRLKLPPDDQIPDSDKVGGAAGGAAKWVIPETEIALVRVPSGPRAGEFLFSAETVAAADSFYKRTRQLPYVRAVPIQGMKERIVNGGGWMFHPGWIEAFPAPLHKPFADQALWKWIGLAMVLALFALFLWFANRVSQLGRDRSAFLDALAQLSLPVLLLLSTPVVTYLLLVQVNLIEEVGVAAGIVSTLVMFLAGAWLAWRLAPVIAEAIIASPSIAPESIDAHLIRVTARLLAIFGSAALLALGADRLGVPVYGIVAGLGVGGLAIALAAQPTIENLIGGLNLFADKPIRVGDVCKYGTETGTVEAIGIRSTRMRGLDRTLTTIPNGVLAKMPLVNLTRRDRILIQSVIGLRYETTQEQLRDILVKLRELLAGRPPVEQETMRVRLVGFGDSSLNIELFAYVRTQNWVEFLGIREDILLRVRDLIEQSGTAMAFPSQTLYLGRDQEPDKGKAAAAEGAARGRREEGSPPFPGERTA